MGAVDEGNGYNPDSGYDPELYTRGSVSAKKFMPSEDGESDLPWGKVVKGIVLTLRVFSKQGAHGFPYHGYDGHDEDADGFTLYFRATEQGVQAMWRVEVKGQKLDMALDYFCLNRLAKLREGGNIEGDDPLIQSITWQAFMPEDAPEERAS